MKIIMVYTMKLLHARNDESRALKANPGCAGDGSTQIEDFQSRSRGSGCAPISTISFIIPVSTFKRNHFPAHLCVFMGEKKSKANSDSLHHVNIIDKNAI